MSVPSDLADLLVRPILASVGTLRPDGAIQINPMWFDWDGSHVRLTHNRTRLKFRNLAADPRITLLIVDPERTSRYLELRGRLSEVVPDPQGDFYVSVALRYGASGQPPVDASERVMLVVEIDRASRIGARPPDRDAAR